MASPERRFRVKIERSSELGMSIKKVEGGAHLVAPFRATLTDERISIELIIDVIDRHPNCTRYSVTANDGAGLLYRTGEVTHGVTIREAMALALQFAVIEEREDGSYVDASSLDLIESVRGRVARRRAPITDDSLKKFADKYRSARAKVAKDGTRWDAEVFAKSIGYGVRHYYNLKSDAKEAGHLKEGE